MTLSYPSLIYLSFSSIFLDLAFRLHILSTVFCASHHITIIPAPLAARLGIRCLYPVRQARPIARLVASVSRFMSVVDMRVSFLQGAVSPVSHRDVGIGELSLGGAFVVCLYLNVRLFFRYLRIRILDTTLFKKFE